ncbi:MAG: 16S rRNA (cytosine(1402)-N(4))-methyltransferase RsmH [bacterium]|nr:16S rRNA (cytosine(1402)-N(4))-methyltransferase RsmH [bacterium]
MESPNEGHIPVLLSEVIHHLITDRDGNYFDGTLGDSGYSKAIMNSLTDQGTLTACDLDLRALEHSKSWAGAYGNRIKIYHNNFSEISEIMLNADIKSLNGIVLDLGISSRQLDDPGRGFSYRTDGPIDMRFDDTISGSALDMINNYSREQLKKIFKEYGEEKRSGLLAKIITESREESPINTTGEFVELMSRRWRPKHFRKSASRIFQALRIAVNAELNNLERFLDECWKWLVPGARLVIVSYHSLEDRLVKNSIRNHKNPCSCPDDFPECRCGKIPDARALTKKPIYPSEDEIRLNSRARSARLRAAEKI